MQPRPSQGLAPIRIHGDKSEHFIKTDRLLNFVDMEDRCRISDLHGQYTLSSKLRILIGALASRYGATDIAKTDSLKTGVGAVTKSP